MTIKSLCNNNMKSFWTIGIGVSVKCLNCKANQHKWRMFCSDGDDVLSSPKLKNAVEERLHFLSVILQNAAQFCRILQMWLRNAHLGSEKLFREIVSIKSTAVFQIWHKTSEKMFKIVYFGQHVRSLFTECRILNNICIKVYTFIYMYINTKKTKISS